MRWVWLSNRRMTFAVRVNDEDRIVDAAPIVRRFIGQNLRHLIRWMGTLGTTTVEVL